MNNNTSYYSDANKTKLEKDMWLILPDYIIGKVKRADEKLEIAVFGTEKKIITEPSICRQAVILHTLPLVSHGCEIEVAFDVAQYLANGAAAIDLIWISEESIEPWDSLTINLGDCPPEDHAYIDVNHNGSDIVEWLIQNRLAEPTGVTRRSGFYTYPMMKLHMAEIRKYALPSDDNNENEEGCRMEEFS